MKKRSEILQALTRLDREIEMLENVLLDLNPLDDVHMDITANYESERPTFFSIPQPYFKDMIRKHLNDLQYRFNQIYKELEDYTA